jgi:hypothetical protein
MDLANRLQRFFQAEISAECRADFPTLKRIPDTYVRKNLYFYMTLDSKEVGAFIEYAAMMACIRNSFVVGVPASDFPQHPMQDRVRAAMAGYWEDEFMGIPMLRTAVSQYKIDHRKRKESCVSEETFTYASSIRSAKAPDIRRAVKAAFAEALECREVEKFGDGHYIYRCRVDGQDVAVWVNYGASYWQLRYWVELPGSDRLARFCYESALSFGNGDWDFLTQDNLAASVGVLPSLVKYCCALPRRIRTYCQ